MGKEHNIESGNFTIHISYDECPHDDCGIMVDHVIVEDSKPDRRPTREYVARVLKQAIRYLETPKENIQYEEETKTIFFSNWYEKWENDDTPINTETIGKVKEVVSKLTPIERKCEKSPN